MLNVLDIAAAKPVSSEAGRLDHYCVATLEIPVLVSGRR
jgi:hypothetical protein